MKIQHASIQYTSSSKEVHRSWYQCEEQAELIIETITAIKQYDISHLATKEDLYVTKAELKQDIAEVKQEITEVKAELKQDIAEVKQEITEVKAELKQEIADVRHEVAELRGEMKSAIAHSKSDTIKWMIGMMTPMAIGIISILVKIN